MAASHLAQSLVGIFLTTVIFVFDTKSSFRKQGGSGVRCLKQVCADRKSRQARFLTSGWAYVILGAALEQHTFLWQERT